MSMEYKCTFNCPYCGTEGRQNFYSSINTKHPNALEMIINGEINKTTCEICMESFKVNAPLLFNNIEKQYAVYFHPTDTSSIDEQNKKLKLALGEDHYIFNANKYTNWASFINEILSRENKLEIAKENFCNANVSYAFGSSQYNFSLLILAALYVLH